LPPSIATAGRILSSSTSSIFLNISSLFSLVSFFTVIALKFFGKSFFIIFLICSNIFPHSNELFFLTEIKLDPKKTSSVPSSNIF
jgi:hypothetical protein